MHVQVVYSVDDTTHTDHFTCRDASRQMRPDGLTNIVFRDGFGVLREKVGELNVRTATYQNAWRILTYED